MIYKPPIKDIVFLLREWIGIKNINHLTGYEDLSIEDIEFILSEAGKFCNSELLPLNSVGDEIGVKLNDGKVTTPPGFKEAYKLYIESGWTGIDANVEHGGSGLPKLVQFYFDEMLSACNLAFKLYSELSHGAYQLLLNSASKEVKDLYLPKLASGAWSGTMCLTEPQCGTDLSLIKTRATLENGKYLINGTKIFITSGDQDLTENILHMVLAKIDGAPEGSKGISVFLVPRNNINQGQATAELNGVSVGSIEKKMGIKGSATCVLNFDNAEGILIGEENRGLAAMFTMMNAERITVGIQGLGFADIAYQNAYNYARERLQSKVPGIKRANKKADPILEQPEIKKILLRMRCQIEGGRALATHVGHYVDVMQKSKNDTEKQYADNLVSLLTPVVKSYLSDLGMESTLAAQQVFGGHGFVHDYGMEQLVRDCRITTIYEGTNEVQAADLVFRKLMIKNGSLIKNFIQHWESKLSHGASLKSTKALLVNQKTQQSFDRFKAITNVIVEQASSKTLHAMSNATDYMRYFSLNIVALLWSDILATIDERQGNFYDNKRKLAVFFILNVLPETLSIEEKIVNGAKAVTDFATSDFDN
jgi:alkylation response protein AidB-like acyl-CoA dehydrogenase